MLEAIATYGKALSMEEDPLAILTMPARRPRDEMVCLVQLDLRDDAGKPQLAAKPIEIDDDTCTRYRWVGNVVGNRPQTYLTTDRLEYLVGANVDNLLAQLKEADLGQSSLYSELLWLLESFYRRLPDNTLFWTWKS